MPMSFGSAAADDANRNRSSAIEANIRVSIGNLLVEQIHRSVNQVLKQAKGELRRAGSIVKPGGAATWMSHCG
jgi:hypothetical protein